MESSKLLSSILPSLLPLLITVFLASLLAHWVMSRLSAADNPKAASDTSYFAIRRYVNQPRQEEPFCALENSLSEDHEELAAFGSWTNCEDLEPPSGLEAPHPAPYGGYYTFQGGAYH